MVRYVAGFTLTLLLLTGCATLKRSLTGPDPQAAPDTAPLVGFSYDPATRKLTIYPEAADDLIVCLPPTYIRYQMRSPVCSDLRELRSYLRSLVPATP